MGLKNKKSLGQNWLKNREILEKIADYSAYGIAEKTGVGLEKRPLCVEIGPGLGYLTTSLLRRFDKVIAVEYDDRLAKNLPGSFPGTNLEVVHGDILEYYFSRLNEPYVVAGNIPYYITSPIIEKVLTAEKTPERVVLLMQKEVAERIMSDKETVLSLFVKNRARVQAGVIVPAHEFTPPPKVDSQVVVMEPFVTCPVVSDEVFELIRRGFASPRKKLVHNLAGMADAERLKVIMGEIGVSVDARPGDLGLTDWNNLYKKLER